MDDLNESLPKKGKKAELKTTTDLKGLTKVPSLDLVIPNSSLDLEHVAAASPKRKSEANNFVKINSCLKNSGSK